MMPTEKSLPKAATINHKKKCLFVMRSFAHFVYHESTLESLVLQGSDLRIAFDPRWSKGRSDEYVNGWLKMHDQAPYHFFPTRNDRWREFLFDLREVASLASYLTRKGQSPFYLNRWESYQSPRITKLLRMPLIGRVVRFAIKSLYSMGVFRAIESAIPPDEKIKHYLLDLAPDVVVVSPSNLRFSEEVEVLKAGRHLGLKTAVPVLTWDNLTTKGLLQIQPDLLLAWNLAHMAEAKTIHKIKRSRIELTGSPFFDKWFDRRRNYEADACRKRAGLKSDSPFITYLGSSANIAKDESGLVDKLAVGLKSDSNLASWQILVRAHPANSYNFTKVTSDNVVSWPTPLQTKGEMSLPETPAALADFQFALKDCVAVVGVNTSAMIEGIINDKPVIALVLEAFSQTQTEASHFQQLLENDVLYIAKSTREAIVLLAQMATGSDPKREQRKKFVESFVRLNGQSAGEQQAKKILQLCH